ncbi:MAG: type II toxin-antitoxin system VapC family toxin [Myxococcales bacterium]|nr:type II toxin-antitoxin system VapC family toxin [Myxococcales bacterium]
MQLLLDTHALLWFVSGDPALSARARRAIEAPASTRSVSIATLWEIAIKVSIGKIALALPLAELVQVGVLDNEMSLVPIAREHGRMAPREQRIVPAPRSAGQSPADRPSVGPSK